MSDNDLPEQVDMAVVTPRRGLNPVWLLPLLALSIGGWLFWKSLVEADIPIEIALPSGAGIVAGKTEVKYQGIGIGTVRDLKLAPDHKGVIAYVDMDRNSAPILRTQTRFWLVKPEIGFAGIQGLDTLLSGNYIALHPGDGEPSHTFTALPAPLADDSALEGLILTLRAPELGSVNIGSPILYNQLRVGEVISYQLNRDHTGVDIKIHIQPDYEQLIHSKTRFWNSSGFTFKGGVSGFKLSAESLASLAIGGISFGTPSYSEPGKSVMDYKTFKLYADHEAAETGVRITLHMPSAEGMQAGLTEIRFKGITVGKIRELRVNDNFDGAVAELIFDPRMAFAINDSTRLWLVKPQISLSEISGIATLISGSYIEFDFEPGTTPRTEFTALPRPPSLRANEAGLHLTLQARELAGLERGTVLHYLQVPIGTVQDYRFAADERSLLVDVHIEERYRHLINPRSRFYNAGGIRLKADLSGVKVESESLTTIIRGGISLFNPPDASPASVRNGSRYSLYASLEAAQAQGPELTLIFADGTGLQVGTPIRHQGISVGELIQVELRPDLQGVVARARLQPQAAALARRGSRFWVARPQLSLARTENLQTLVTGVFIEVSPGQGEPSLTFTTLNAKPDDVRRADGLQIIVQTPDLGSLSAGAPVLYRNLPVGRIDHFGLAEDARKVNVFATIEPRYAGLVRANSQFWNASGISVDAGLFRGIKIQTGTLETLVTGGIAFATPEQTPLAAPAAEHDHFTLHPGADPLWLQWQPAIAIPATE